MSKDCSRPCSLTFYGRLELILYFDMHMNNNLLFETSDLVILLLQCVVVYRLSIFSQVRYAAGLSVTCTGVAMGSVMAVWLNLRVSVLSVFILQFKITTVFV